MWLLQKCPHSYRKILIDQSINSEDCNENIFRKLLGSFQYLSNVSRPDITFAVNYLAQFSTKPKMIHFKSLKRILCYLKETKEYSIKYSRNWNGETIHAFADANWAYDKIDRKSVSGILKKLGYNDSPIIWKSSKQKTVALSSCEAEYMALALCVQGDSMVMNIFKTIGLDYL